MSRNTSGLGVGFDATCEHCKSAFHAVSTKQNVCSVDCRFALYGRPGAADECWVWAGPTQQGYGRLFIDQNYATGKRVSVSAHRAALEKHLGRPIADGLCVMHSCDNRACVNPAHLREGTWGENNTDRSRKGRSGSRVYSAEEKARYSIMFRGSANKLAKLTEDQARAIKYQEPGPCSEIGKRYGVSKSLVKNIRGGRAWRHV